MESFFSGFHQPSKSLSLTRTICVEWAVSSAFLSANGLFYQAAFSATASICSSQPAVTLPQVSELGQRTMSHTLHTTHRPGFIPTIHSKMKNYKKKYCDNILCLCNFTWMCCCTLRCHAFCLDRRVFDTGNKFLKNLSK